MKVNDMRQEYDFSKGQKGKYLKRYQAGTNIVVLDPEVAKLFPDSQAVNDALKTLMRAVGHNKALLRTRKARRKA
jgi:hypothetical protein